MKQEDKKREPMPSVLKHVRKQNPSLSNEEALLKAFAMEARYEEANKERDAKRNIEIQKQIDRSLKREHYNLLFEYMDELRK